MSIKTVENSSVFPWETNYKKGKEVLVFVNDWLSHVAENAEPIYGYADIFTAPFDPGDTVNVSCTDERPIDIGTVAEEDQDKEFIRLPGGAAGILGAIESVKPDITREEMSRELYDTGLNLYNHIDDVHGSEEEKVGCGYLALLSMSQAPRVFGKKIADVHAFVEDMERTLGVPTVTLHGEHVAQNGGFLINLHDDRALNPSGAAHGAFFSLDLEIISTRLAVVADVFAITETQQKNILVRLTLDNFIACYVLSGGNIDVSKCMVTGPYTQELREVIEEAYRQFSEKERMSAMNEMIEERSH